MKWNRLQKLAVAFGFVMLGAVVLMTPWADHVAGQHVTSIGAWAPLWAPPSETAVIDMLRLAVEALLVVMVTSVAVLMLSDHHPEGPPVRPLEPEVLQHGIEREQDA